MTKLEMTEAIMAAKSEKDLKTADLFTIFYK